MGFEQAGNRRHFQFVGSLERKGHIMYMNGRQVSGWEKNDLGPGGIKSPEAAPGGCE